MYSLLICTWRRLKKSRALRPMKVKARSPAPRSSAKRPAARMMLALKPPHRPLSEVTTTSSTFCPARSWSKGWASGLAREAMELRTSIIFRA